MKVFVCVFLTADDRRPIGILGVWLTFLTADD